jgi:hypothetical protein
MKFLHVAVDVELPNAWCRRCRYRMLAVGDVVVESEYVEPKST